MPLNIKTNGGVPATTNFSDNEYELLADYTVSGSAITSYTFSGLKLNTDEEVVFVVSIVNSGVGANYRLSTNGNTTQSNYYYQLLGADSTTIEAVRGNQNYISYVSSSKNGLHYISIKLTNNGYFTWQSHEINVYGGTTPIIYNYYGTSTFTTSQITSLTIDTASGATGIGIGSRFQLYKVKGQVQQTWATT